MNTEWYIARRMIRAGKLAGKTSRPIIGLSVWGIGIGVAIMVLSLAIVTGFRKEIREKIIGFGAHIQINEVQSPDPLSASSRIPIQQTFYPHLDTLKEVCNIQIYATQPAIIETDQDVLGAIVKGIGNDFDQRFFLDNIVKGEFITWNRESNSKEIVVSQFIASKLRLEIGDKVSLYLVRNQDDIRPRNFNVIGIYETGLEDFDRQIAFIDIGHLQKINQWGIQAYLHIVDTCSSNAMIIEATSFGGDGQFQYSWNNSLTGPGPHRICIHSDTTIQVIVSDASGTFPDTASLAIDLGNAQSEMQYDCNCPPSNSAIQTWTSGGSQQYYTGGFEVMLTQFEDLEKMDEIIYENIGFDLNTSTVTERHPEIFSWLEMLDINVWVVIVLMVAVAMINVISILLILIIEKTRMIGLLKSMGASNWSIRKIFLYNAAYLLIAGISIGNVIGIGLALLQKHYSLISLPQENYYLSAVPVLLKMEHIVILNVGTAIVGVLVLLLPSYVVSKISPVKALRFN